MKSVLVAFVATLILSISPISASAAKLVAQIDISQQRMTVLKNGRVLSRWRVSTARRGYYTPRGTYSAKRMHRQWYSRKYDMSPMPHSIFFHGGYAIHGTGAIRSLGRPASHGCVRLHPSHAAQLYNWTRQVGMRNMRVVIKN
ncbi:L,D-transpeptidase [Notoacmeibacter sp. MSK16QG-6]|uniref:L,D-transpeptidase n=1 Tax=Notoacmeibacter sp. MSK16QG-6 TaxID=2957982 RepID=UPI0020A12281|nr:L,D-transpeptidase [Notoacmeibacter sp. MSK16QG-6]MCP1199607.1 L,D-transpeptidase [Notoacmeibacter sp. MSK16QG-6]